MGLRIFNSRIGDGAPVDPLTELADRMAALLPDDVRAIIMLDRFDADGHGGSAGIAFVGYVDDDQALEVFRRHWRAFQMARLDAPEQK